MAQNETFTRSTRRIKKSVKFLVNMPKSRNQTADEQSDSFVHFEGCRHASTHFRHRNHGNATDVETGGTLVLKRHSEKIIEEREGHKGRVAVEDGTNGGNDDDGNSSIISTNSITSQFGTSAMIVDDQDQFFDNRSELSHQKSILQSLDEMEATIINDNADAEKIKKHLSTLRSTVMSQNMDPDFGHRDHLLKKSFNKINNYPNVVFIKNDMNSNHRRLNNDVVAGDLALGNALATIEMLKRTLQAYKHRVIHLQDRMNGKQVVKDVQTQTDKINFHPEDRTRIPIRMSKRLRSTDDVVDRKSSILWWKNIKAQRIVQEERRHDLPDKMNEVNKDKNEEKIDLKTTIKNLELMNSKLKLIYMKEKALRETYYNTIQDLKGKIRVFCRIRPLSQTDLDAGYRCVTKLLDDNHLMVKQTLKSDRKFHYDQIFLKHHTQEDVFGSVKPLMQSVLDGFNVCIFAYGQTGSGKTYTMMGDDEQRTPGITPRAFNELFSLIERNRDNYDYKVHSYMLELYNDKLLDLLTKHTTTLEIRRDKYGMIYLNGTTIRRIDNSQDLIDMFNDGKMCRHVSHTKMNRNSSRSHCIVTVVVEITNLMTQINYRGKLSLVDLAGSERQSKSGTENAELKEANSINKSLSALGDVISALTTEQSFIPYRNNKLTMLMQDCLGGNAKTVMFVNISSSENNVQETIMSLEYASRVKQVMNKASKNSDVCSSLDKNTKTKKAGKKGVKFSLPN